MKLIRRINPYLRLAFTACVILSTIAYCWKDYLHAHYVWGEEVCDAVINLSMGYIGAFTFFAITDIWDDHHKAEKSIERVRNYTRHIYATLNDLFLVMSSTSDSFRTEHRSTEILKYTLDERAKIIQAHRQFAESNRENLHDALFRLSSSMSTFRTVFELELDKIQMFIPLLDDRFVVYHGYFKHMYGQMPKSDLENTDPSGAYDRMNRWAKDMSFQLHMYDEFFGRFLRLNGLTRYAPPPKKEQELPPPSTNTK